MNDLSFGLRTRRFLGFAVVGFACISLLACGGSAEIALPLQTNNAPIKGELAVQPDPLGGLTAGVDYDTSKLTVSLVQGAVVPAGLAGTMPQGLAAADGSNAILRTDREYETVTDSIAARYNLTIRNQVYQGNVRLVGFGIPDGVDGQAVVSAMQNEFAGAVESVSFSMILRIDAEVNDPNYTSSTSTSGPQWGHRRIGCSTAWDTTRGAGVRVAVVDTGVHFAHEELQAQVLDPEVEFPGENLDIVNGNNTVEDTRGHGTFIAGLIAAEGNNNRTIVGVAYECEIIPIKISNNGSAWDVDMANGIILGANLGAKVVNISFGGVGFRSWFNTVMNDVRAAGVLVVSSAGNDWANETNYPGGYSAVLNVGSTQDNDARSLFSNWDSTVAIAAPGERLKSCAPGTSSYNTNGFGTSYSTPLVVAGAALLWAADPTLTVDEVETLLISTGQPTTGFTQGDVPRLDIGAALVGVSGVGIRAPLATKLVYSGTISLNPTVLGSADQVEVYLNGELVDSKSSAPFEFEIDTSAINFGLGEIEFIATSGELEAADTFRCIVDNSSPAFPVFENFDAPAPNFVGIDLRTFSLAFLQELKQVSSGEWTRTDVAENGPAAWTVQSTDVFDGAGAARLATDDLEYGSFELDALVSKKINLSSQSAATLVFQTHFNLEDGGFAYDKGWVFATADGGLSFTPAQFRSGGQAFFSGYQPDWSLAEIDLSAFAGETIHLALVFESDTFAVGENETAPKGWWVDGITVGVNYSTDLPTIDTVSLEPYIVLGNAVNITEVMLEVSGLQNVNRVRYILDVEPLGVITAEDITINTDTDPFDTLLEIPRVPNQLANLQVQYFDIDNNSGALIDIPIYVFNLPGDVDGNNIVNQADLDAFATMLGVTSADPGYLPFFDSDFDGIITEADAAAVGYFWGSSV